MFYFDIEPKDTIKRKPLNRVFCTINYDVDEADCPVCGNTVYSAIRNCGRCGCEIDWKMTPEELERLNTILRDREKEHRYFTLD